MRDLTLHWGPLVPKPVLWTSSLTAFHMEDGTCPIREQVARCNTWWVVLQPWEMNKVHSHRWKGQRGQSAHILTKSQNFRGEQNTQNCFLQLSCPSDQENEFWRQTMTWSGSHYLEVIKLDSSSPKSQYNTIQYSFIHLFKISVTGTVPYLLYPTAHNNYKAETLF